MCTSTPYPSSGLIADQEDRPLPLGLPPCFSTCRAPEPALCDGNQGNRLPVPEFHCGKNTFTFRQTSEHETTGV